MLNTKINKIAKSFLIIGTIFMSACTSIPGKKGVIIDPGHGGKDSGAQRYGIKEKDITLSVAKKTANSLKSMGIPVVMTRTSDVFVSLPDRTKIARQHPGYVFVSIHGNDAKCSSVCGAETFYYMPSGHELAKTILQKLSRHTTPRFCHKRELHVLHHHPLAATLVEIGYLSNHRERTNLCNDIHQKRLAMAIASGISSFRP